MNIGIIGNYGATNVGDEAILEALLSQLTSHEVTVFSADPQKKTMKSKYREVSLFPLGFRSFFKHGFLASFKALKKVDVVILGGGGLFQDNYLYACFLWAWQLFWVRWLHKPYFIYATGVGPLSTPKGKRLALKAYQEAAVITVRDEDSAEVLRDLGISKTVHITADPVFLFAKKLEKLKPKERTKKLFIISLRPWIHSNQKLIALFETFLEYLKQERQAEFIFVVMQQIKEDDLKIVQPLIKKVGGRLYFPQSFMELLGVMQQAEFAIGMRYHFMIAALLTHTPLIPISYSSKTTHLFEGSPLKKFLIPFEDLSVEHLKEQLKELSVGYNNAMVFEKALVNQGYEKAQENAERLKAFLQKYKAKTPSSEV